MYFSLHKIVFKIYWKKTRHCWILPGYECVVWWEKLALQGTGVNISRFVNQSNTNTPEFDLARIRLKYVRNLFWTFTVTVI